MDFIPLEFNLQSHPTRFLYLFVCTPVAIFAMVYAVTIFVKAKKKPIEARGKDSREAGVFVSMAAFAMVIGVALTVLQGPPQPNSLADVKMKFSANSERISRIQSEIQAKYGLKLTEGQVSALGYPYDKPTTQFSVYGSFDKKDQVDGAQFSKSTVYLVWVNEHFELSESKDGETFAPLAVSYQRFGKNDGSLSAAASKL